MERYNVTAIGVPDSQRLYRLLKCIFVDTVYMNVMKMDPEGEGPNYMYCVTVLRSI
jgi:hypothetical protein